MNNPAYRAEYEALAPEFELTQALVEARTKAGLTREELANVMTEEGHQIASESGRFVSDFEELI